MSRGPREIMRSEEVEVELSGPANPIPDQSLDCGCKQMRFPQLAKYATRKLYVGLFCWIGSVQAAIQAYLGLASSTIARRFNFPPEIMDWFIVFNDGLLLSILALPIAYWGDRIHRPAWTGALVLLQSAGLVFLIIPHFSHTSRIIEETTNVTHLSLYAEDNPDLCAATGLARLSIEDDVGYITLVIIIISQLFNCMGTIAYFTLGISYLDDNTRKRHVAIPLSLILAFKIIGILFGYLLAWGCLRIDAENLTLKIVSYREQIGAWWLGLPILAVLLALPALPVSWLPRRLPSEVVEQAAASILDLAGRTSPISESTVSDGETKKFGDTGYFASFVRLVTNKVLICNILATVFCGTALVNFASNEDIFLESRFYVPRPSGLLAGFGDPLTSRVVSNLLRPLLIGLCIIISGVILVKMRPRAKWLVCYNIIIGIIAASIIFSLAFANCKKPIIAGTNPGGSISLLKYCNKNCRCLKDANFRPVCDAKNSYIFYTPCHAGCTGLDDSGDINKYTGCSCIAEITGLLGNNEVIEGACDSTTCQVGWIVFEISTIISYSLIASGTVSSLLIGLRSTFIQDKALAIGLWIAITSFVIYVPGKMLYWKIADSTCIHRGNSPSLCHLHDPENLGSYLAYMTTLLLLIGISFEIFTFFLCRNLRLYKESNIEFSDVAQVPGQSIPLVDQTSRSQIPEISSSATDVNADVVIVTSTAQEEHQSNVNTEVSTSVQSSVPISKKVKEYGPLQYGPLGPGNPRTSQEFPKRIEKPSISDSEDSDDKQIHNRRAPLSLSTIAYKRLEADSDEMTDSSTGSPKFGLHVSSPMSGFLPTNDFQLAKSVEKSKNRPYPGDFNEVGIPIVEYPLTSMNSRSIGSILASPEITDRIKRYGMKKKLKNEGENILGSPSRPLSSEYASSGFESSASDVVKSSDPKSIINIRNISKSTSNIPNPKPKLYGYTTAL